MKRAIFAALFCFLLLPATSDAKTFKAKSVFASAGLCQLRYGGGIACFGDAVPATYTDGYLWIRRGGKVRFGDAGGLVGPYAPNTPHLRPGNRWNKRGIRCKAIRGGIKCSNGQHGFRLKKRAFKTW